MWTLLDAEPEATNPLTATYLNRLSDLLFILGAGRQPRAGDVKWQPQANRAECDIGNRLDGLAGCAQPGARAPSRSPVCVASSLPWRARAPDGPGPRRSRRELNDLGEDFHAVALDREEAAVHGGHQVSSPLRRIMTGPSASTPSSGM